MIKGIIYDHDGTLINTEAMHYACWQEIMRDYSVDFTQQEYIDEHNGVPTNRNTQILIEKYQLDVGLEELMQRKMELSWHKFESEPCPPMPFALEVLKASFDDGYQLAIATGAGRKEIDYSFAAYPIARYFQGVVTRNDVTNSKPAPDVYLQASELMALNPSECVAIEDTATGIAAAKSAGMICLGVLNDYSNKQDLAQADHIFENIQLAYHWITAQS